MTDTAPLKKGTQPHIELRTKAKRETLTENELRQARVHVARHPDRSTEWLSDLLWLTPEFIKTQCR